MSLKFCTFLTRKLKKHTFKLLIFGFINIIIILFIYSNIRYDRLVKTIAQVKLNDLNPGAYFERSASVLPPNDCFKVKEHNITRYLLRYPHLLECKNEYNVWSVDKPIDLDEEKKYNYSKAADKRLHELRITRAVIFFFPIEKADYFKSEFLWLFRSWINMIRYEPTRWRTDLVFFTNYDKSQATKSKDPGNYS